MRLASALTGSAALVVGSLGCSAILGLQEPTIDNAIEGGTGGDGGSNCAKDCLGGECKAGVCQPVAIALNQGGPFMLTAFGSRIYWTNVIGSTVMSADKVDASTTLLAATGSGVDSPIGLDVDDSGVYFANNGSSGTVIRCDLDGCPSPQVLYDAGFGNSDLHLNGGSVYYLEADFNEIDRVPVGGGPMVPVAMPDTANNFALLARIATDGTYIYWSETYNDKIVRKKLSGGAAQTIYSLPTNAAPSPLLIDGTTLYFATLGGANGAGSIAYGNTDGTGGVQTLAAAQHYPYALAIDSTDVYWTTEGDFDMNSKLTAPGGVFRCAKTGCGGTPVELASGINDGRGIAVDDRAIYWASFETGTGDGKIWRLAK